MQQTTYEDYKRVGFENKNCKNIKGGKIMENKLPEMELENLETMQKLLKERVEDQIMLVGQVNYIGEKDISVEVTVTTLTDYNDLHIIMSYREEIGRETLPANPEDTEAVKKMEELESKIEKRKTEIKKQLESKEFLVEYGVYK